jgi:preprotein translocase SecE subunit
MNNIKQGLGRISSYMGEVAAEFRRISWPVRKELLESTVVVVTFIVLLAIVVLACDQVIKYFMMLIHA